ncbi:hypothetical protein [Streptomyces sp. Caat 7-52]|uniref:hypothetical protein n=1 Tax=Streptomyces sp. Caat 7-52 TaxID=2949637 RepID=UPI002034DBDA|nr:hypothetical protein [Streptomyces sp. Caat 7-52]
MGREHDSPGGTPGVGGPAGTTNPCLRPGQEGGRAQGAVVLEGAGKGLDGSRLAVTSLHTA